MRIYSKYLSSGIRIFFSIKNLSGSLNKNVLTSKKTLYFNQIILNTFNGKRGQPIIQDVLFLNCYVSPFTAL